MDKVTLIGSLLYDWNTDQPREANSLEYPPTNVKIESPVVFNVRVERVSPKADWSEYNIVALKESMEIVGPALRCHDLDGLEADILVTFDLVRTEGDFVVVKALFESEGFCFREMKVNKKFVFST